MQIGFVTENFRYEQTQKVCVKWILDSYKKTADQVKVAIVRSIRKT